jgi:hypothetical protein
MYEDYKNGKDITSYQTNGTEDKRMFEPKKTMSSKNNQQSYSPSKGSPTAAQQ